MIKILNFILSTRHLQNAIKILSLVALVFLIFSGLQAFSDDDKIIKELRNTNIGNLLVWSYWWPIIIILAIFFGRVWCMLCPVELITSFFSKIGLKLKRPKWILSGWMITLFYAGILFAGIGIFTIHRNPTYMAAYLLLIVLVSIITGFLFEKNTFCRYFCPVGYLLGLYSRLSFFGLRVIHLETCDGCRDKSCVQKRYTYNIENKSCGVDIYPANIEDNTNCILCGGCAKTCNTYKNIKTINRPNPAIIKIGFANDLFKINTLTIAEFGFLYLVSGFVVYEILSEYDATKEILLLIPDYFTNTLNIQNKILTSLVESIYLFIFLPFVLWMLPFIITKISGLKISIKTFLLNYSLAFIPLIAAAHFGKAILKMSSRIPYFEHITNDLTGLINANKIVSGKLILAKIPEWGNLIVSVLITVVLFVGLFVSFKTITKANNKLFPNNNRASSLYFIPLFYSTIFIVTIILWRWF